jgi:hypothetical protein
MTATFMLTQTVSAFDAIKVQVKRFCSRLQGTACRCRKRRRGQVDDAPLWIVETELAVRATKSLGEMLWPVYRRAFGEGGLVT